MTRALPAVLRADGRRGRSLPWGRQQGRRDIHTHVQPKCAARASPNQKPPKTRKKTLKVGVIRVSGGCCSSYNSSA
eukprot:525277-Prymnesium_polylepis.1